MGTVGCLRAPSPRPPGALASGAAAHAPDSLNRLTAAAAWIRALPGRYGRRTLIALAVIAAIGLGLRAYAVVHPVANPADDSHAYYGLAKALYEEGSYGGPEFRDSSDWSPGAPLLYAASFFLTGGAREGTARIVEALMGTAAILVVFALGARLASGVRRGSGSRSATGAPPSPGPISPLARWTGLLAAFAVAVYPPFIHSTGELMSEPPAILTLPAAVLAFLWAGEKERWWAWLVPGFLFGLTAMFRPEYLFVAALFVVLAAIRLWIGRGPRPALLAPRGECAAPPRARGPRAHRWRTWTAASSGGRWQSARRTPAR